MGRSCLRRPPQALSFPGVVSITPLAATVPFYVEYSSWQVEARAIILLQPIDHHTCFVVLPDDRRLLSMRGVVAYFRDGDHEAGTVVAGLYARLLPHVDFEHGQCVVSCSTPIGSDPCESSSNLQQIKARITSVTPCAW